MNLAVRLSRRPLTPPWLRFSLYAVAAVLLLDAVAIAASGGRLPFAWPSREGESFGTILLDANAAVLEALLLVALILWLTRHRALPRLTAALPRPAVARRELGWLLAYGLLAQVAGVAIAHAVGWRQFSFHIGGTLYGAHQHDLVSQAAFLAWVGYNAVAYVVLPLVVIARRYPARALWLRSHDRRADVRLIVTVLAIESTVQIAAASHAIVDLSPRQLALGVPLTFGLYFLGTVLPTLIFVESLIVPRLLRVSGSAPLTIVLGGLVYACMHLFDAWVLFDSPRDIVLSLVFLLLTYAAPGMVKATLTVRTGNAWVHAWAYHAIAPHTLLDTPLVVRVFRL